MSANEIIQGEPPTPEEKFFVQWGRESLKNNIALANNILQRLVTLYLAILGGSMLFLDESIIHSSVWRAVAMMFFLFGLISALLGVLPYKEQVDIRKPQDIKAFKLKASGYKFWLAKISGWLGIFGFATAIIAFILGK